MINLNALIAKHKGPIEQQVAKRQPQQASRQPGQPVGVDEQELRSRWLEIVRSIGPLYPSMTFTETVVEPGDRTRIIAVYRGGSDKAAGKISRQQQRAWLDAFADAGLKLSASTDWRYLFSITSDSTAAASARMRDKRAAAKGSQARATRLRTLGPRGRYAYSVTYEVVTPGEEEDEYPDIERGYVIRGRQYAMPQGGGEVVRAWLRENDPEMPLPRADDYDVEERLGIDPQRVMIPEWVRYAISFVQEARHLGATECSSGGMASQGDWWSTEPEQDYRTGAWTTKSIHLEDQRVATIAGVKHVKWPDEAWALIGAMLRTRGGDWSSWTRRTTRAARHPIDEPLVARVLSVPLQQIQRARQQFRLARQ